MSVGNPHTWKFQRHSGTRRSLCHRELRRRGCGSGTSEGRNAMPRRVRKSVLGSQTSAAAGTLWDPEDWDPTDPAWYPPPPPNPTWFPSQCGHPCRPRSSWSRSSIGILLRRLVEGEEKSWSCGCWMVFLPKWPVLGTPAWGPYTSLHTKSRYCAISIVSNFFCSVKCYEKSDQERL